MEQPRNQGIGVFAADPKWARSMITEIARRTANKVASSTDFLTTAQVPSAAKAIKRQIPQIYAACRL
jgi:hypothetical protein